MKPIRLTPSRFPFIIKVRLDYIISTAGTFYLWYNRLEIGNKLDKRNTHPLQRYLLANMNKKIYI